MQWRRELAWRPGDLGWRIAALFMVGSFLFALGSFPLYWGLVDARVVGITFCRRLALLHGSRVQHVLPGHQQQRGPEP